jgi:hypothetical protein
MAPIMKTGHTLEMHLRNMSLTMIYWRGINCFYLFGNREQFRGIKLLNNQSS